MEKQKDNVKKLRFDVQHDITLIAKEVELINKKIDFLMEVHCKRVSDENVDRGMVM